jgi:hypothetical protein
MIPDNPYFGEMVEVDKTVNDYLQFSPPNIEGEFEGEFAVVSEMWTLTQRDFNRRDGNHEYDLGCIYWRTGALNFDGLDVY